LAGPVPDFGIVSIYTGALEGRGVLIVIEEERRTLDIP